MTKTVRTTCWFTIGEERYGPADVTLTERPIFVNRKVTFRNEGVFTLDAGASGLPSGATRAQISLPDGRPREVTFTDRASDRVGMFTTEGRLF